MRGEWIEVALGDLFKVKHGFAFKGEFFTDDPQPEVLVTPGNFAIGGGFQDDKRKYYRGPVPTDYVLRTGQIVVTMTDLSKQSDTLGFAARVPNDSNVWLHNQRVGLLVFNPSAEADARFVEYLLRSHEYRAWVVGSATGTTVKHTSPSRIEGFRTRVPPPAEQRAIAHILGTLDDKIELNRRRNQTLEAMARALFKDWFVDFGPVRAKMEAREPYLPADLWQHFPDRLDDDGKPEGWRSATLADFASLNPESWTKKNAPHEIRYVDLSNTKQGTVEGAARLPWSEAPSRAQRILRPGDTIVGTVRPGNQSFALIGDKGMTGSTGFAVLRPLEKDFRDFVFLAATSPENIERLTHLADGAAYPAVRPDVVLNSPVIVPPEEVANDVLHGFASVISSWLDAVEHNKHESRTLAQLRDTLLPKLISGELRIAEAERFLARAEALNRMEVTAT